MVLERPSGAFWVQQPDPASSVSSDKWLVTDFVLAGRRACLLLVTRNWCPVETCSEHKPTGHGGARRMVPGKHWGSEGSHSYWTLDVWKHMPLLAVSDCHMLQYPVLRCSRCRGAPPLFSPHANAVSASPYGWSSVLA